MTDVHIDGSLAHHHVRAPGFGQQRISRNHPPGTPHQRHQNIEFNASQLHGQTIEFRQSSRNFDADVWSARCFEIVVNGNVQKFRQNPAMQEFLLSTGDAILVEAALRDQIWGIGLGEHNERASDPAQWRGRNMLRFALTEFRTRLRTV